MEKINIPSTFTPKDLAIINNARFSGQLHGPTALFAENVILPYICFKDDPKVLQAAFGETPHDTLVDPIVLEEIQKLCQKVSNSAESE